MSLIKISKDEVWPVYRLSPASEAGHDVIDAPDELIKRYEATEAAWFAVQDELEALFNEHCRDGD